MHGHKPETELTVLALRSTTKKLPALFLPSVKCGRNVSLGEKIAARKRGTVGWSGVSRVWPGGRVMETLAYASYGANVIPMHTRMHTRVLAHTWSRHGVTVARAPSSSLLCGTHVSHTCTPL